MRLVVTVLARDEADVIGEMVGHCLAMGAAAVVVTDNGSRDGTREVLSHWERTGRVVVLTEAGRDHAQDRWVTRMARLAATELDADWVVNADADEFWWPLTAPTLVEALAAVPTSYGRVCARVRDLLPVEGPGPFHQRMVVRDPVAGPVNGAPHLPKTCHRAAPDVEVGMGNHRVRSPSLGPVWPAYPLEVLHVPLRSYAQYERKVRQGTRAVLASTVHTSEVCSHWRADYELLRQGRLRRRWDSLALTPRQAQEGLNDGSLVLDRRLADTLPGPPGWSDDRQPLDRQPRDLQRVEAR